MATYTPNYNLSKPEATDNFDAFRASYGDNMDKIDQNMGGGGGGHTIVDPTGTDMPQENKLQFTGAVNVSDDAVNGQTVVDVEGGGNYYLNTIYSTEEKKIGYWTDGKPLYQRVFDLGSDLIISPYSFTNTSIDASQMQRLVDAWGIYSTGITIYSLMANISNGIIRLQTDRNGASANVRYVVLQYTKTTDTPELNPQTGGVIYLPTIYSDEEREVGVWRDGKPLYQKTILVTSIVSGNNTINHGISNVDKIVNAVGTFFSNANNSSPIPNGNLQTAWSVSMFDFGTTTFTISVGSSWVQYFDYIQVTIQYTKTTDTAGSGSWTPSGANAVHYSTNEQVIGTWIDGKPLYERAFLQTTFSANANTWYKTSIPKGSMKYLIDVFVVFENATTPSVHKGMSGGFVDDYLAINSFRNVGIDAGTTCYVVAQYTKTTDV